MGEVAGPGIVLVGYRGTGKTTVGRVVAARLGLPFFDSDRELGRLAGCSIEDIFAKRGESAFRDLEERAIEALVAENPTAVFATGGGAILRPANVRRMRDHGTVVWLTARVETLADRLANDPEGRPALTSLGTLGEIAEVLSAREPLYRRAAHFEVATDGLDPSQVADRIILPLGLGDDPGATGGSPTSAATLPNTGGRATSGTRGEDGPAAPSGGWS